MVPPASPPAAGDAEAQAFAIAMLRDDVAALDAFLTLYPTSRFAERVRQERQRLFPPDTLVVAPIPLPSAPIAKPCHGVALAGLRERTAARLTADEACALQPKDIFKECTVCPVMAVVPSGAFTMGSPATEPGRFDDEGPQHEVHFAAPFAVGKFAVTFDEWEACVAAAAVTGRKMRDGNTVQGR
jgi:formylglycine-generating enzyme required for sulfatase activity